MNPEGYAKDACLVLQMTIDEMNLFQTNNKKIVGFLTCYDPFSCIHCYLQLRRWILQKIAAAPMMSRSKLNNMHILIFEVAVMHDCVADLLEELQ